MLLVHVHLRGLGWSRKFWGSRIFTQAIHKLVSKTGRYLENGQQFKNACLLREAFASEKLGNQCFIFRMRNSVS
jgi:hypothetical protein